MALKVEWWGAGLPPEGAVQAFASAALLHVIIGILMQERISAKEITPEDIARSLGGGKKGDR